MLRTCECGRVFDTVPNWRCPACGTPGEEAAQYTPGDLTIASPAAAPVADGGQEGGR